MMKMSEKTWNKNRKLKEKKIEQALKWVTNRGVESFTKRALLAGPWKGIKPGTAVRFLKEMRDRGLILMHGSTRKAYYTLAGDSDMAAAIEEVTEVAEVEGELQNPWLVARSVTGQRALNIATICDALLAGEAGLNALAEIKNQAVLILGDLELLEE
jgi:hypothetical protein